jgi:hypothetical protein
MGDMVSSDGLSVTGMMAAAAAVAASSSSSAAAASTAPSSSFSSESKEGMAPVPAIDGGVVRQMPQQSWTSLVDRDNVVSVVNDLVHRFRQRDGATCMPLELLRLAIMFCIDVHTFQEHYSDVTEIISLVSMNGSKRTISSIR